MEHQNHDKVFFVNFSVVLGALFALTVVIAVVAGFITPDPEEGTPEQVAALSARIAPLTQAITDPAELAKLTAKTDRAPYSGQEVVDKICGACHKAGVLNAPKIGDAAAWGTRSKAEGGLDGLVAAAIKGKNQMPPKGGDPSLSDDEIKAAVQILSGG